MNIKKGFIPILVASFLLLPYSIWAQTATTTPGGGEGNVVVNSTGTHYLTIQEALDAAAPNDTVNVGAGTYNENILISKPVTLMGAGSGTTTINGGEQNAAIRTNADTDVTIQGFTITGGAGLYSAGIYNLTDISNLTIANNVISGNSGGIFLRCTDNCVIRDNVITSNNINGPSSGRGIDVMNSSNLTVENNRFSGGTNPAVFFEADANGFPARHTNFIFRNNSVEDQSGGLRLPSLDGGTITGNIFNNSGEALVLSGADANIGISENTFSNGIGGILITNTGTSGTSSNITLSGNNYTNNSEYNVRVIDGAYSGVFVSDDTSSADTVPPVIASSTDIMITATSSNGIIVNYDTPTTTDNVDTSVTATCVPQSGTNFAVGTTTVTCTATDTAGNTATSTFMVTVNLESNGDTTAPDAPVILTPSQSTSTNPALIFGTAEASSTISITGGLNSDPVLNVTTLDGNWMANVNLKNGLNHLQAVAIDAAGNVSGTSTVDITYATSTGTTTDTTAPIFETHPDVFANATSSAGVIVNFNLPTTTDNLDLHPDVSCDPSSGSTFGLGTTTVMCTALDNASNTATTSFRVIVSLVSPSTTPTTTPTTTPPRGGGGGGSSGGRHIPFGLGVAFFRSNPNSAVGDVFSRMQVAVGLGIPPGQVLGLSTFHFTRNLRIGSRGDDVTELQRRLQESGIYDGPITGYYGSLTAAAVRAFQTKVDLPREGTVGPRTREVLNNS